MVLVGFMGTGKTTVGRAVARMLGRPFQDTDLLVAARAGRPIPEIFAHEGEAAFRRHEAAVVAEVGARFACVLATGGGVLHDPENVRALRANGVLVALRARPEVILRRVGGARAHEHRPLLAGDEPLARIQALLAAREPLYRQADLQLDTSDLGPKRVARIVLERISSLSAGWFGG